MVYLFPGHSDQCGKCTGSTKSVDESIGKDVKNIDKKSEEFAVKVTKREQLFYGDENVSFFSKQNQATKEA
jgi:hypothetical protein